MITRISNISDLVNFINNPVTIRTIRIASNALLFF